jgi:predicted GH43/DUF377 family glycosyl hydrolase
MKFKTLFIVAVIAVIAIGFSACNGKGNNEQSAKEDTATIQVIDNKDEVTFLRTFLDKYLTLHGKQAQELARKHLTEEFYSDYIENCNNQDNAIDIICEVTTNEKVEKVDTIMKGIEDPSSFIVQVQAVDAQGKPFSAQYDMTVVNQGGTFKLGDSQVND